MSGSIRLHGESDNSRVELPVFVSPTELIFAFNKRRLLLTVFNPYDNEAQFKIMTTSPERFDVSITKGTIKPNRRIDVNIRLPSQVIDSLPEPSDVPQIIDHFRVSLQVGQLKGNKPVKVRWCLNADLLDTTATEHGLLDEKTMYKSSIRQLKPSTSLINQSANSNLTSTSQKSYPQQARLSQSISNTRPPRQQANLDHSNVNMICTLCTIVCVFTLFLPLAIDFELCKKYKSLQDQESAQTSSFLSQLSSIFSVSYEMKLGCSFALGLFTYRLISTL